MTETTFQWLQNDLSSRVGDLLDLNVLWRQKFE
jgi:hypothetical protein